MKKSYVIALVIIVAGLMWFLRQGNASYSASQTTAKEHNKTPELAAMSAKSEVPAVKSSIKKMPEEQHEFNEDIAKAASAVAQQYQQSLAFPPYSQPLTVYDEDRLKPNQFFPVSSPVGEQGGELTLSLSQYRYVYPQAIKLTISAQNLDKAQVALSNTDTKQPLKTHSGVARDNELAITFKGEEDFPRNLQLLVEADIAGKMVPVVAQIQYMPPSATLTSFDNAYPRNDNMIVPANLTVIKSGLYRLRANLYSGTSPLAHLVAKARLNEGSQQIDFKAHWSVLPKQTNDLRLRDFVIERMSPSPGERNSFGQSEISEFTIEDFAYDSLQQLPYQANKQEMQSLEFLQGLAAGK
ncbi:hypothetical protein [Pseudoalteromonas sp. BSi20439]|jgi:hypothetical protein|uniref:hypothetical protein n=1 Tax=Pseudoalteromonas sp. BSi20439 TaxID=420915 RepID=UPI0002319E52|nr:hypothetical protein [Pseudoalteromonas sp. BSi20439]GAA73022.1 hypothetical protein P20439_3137 [Pseudoalteromonas sp. BSi20439]